MPIIHFLSRMRWYILATLLFAAGTYYYFGAHSNTTTAAASYYVIRPVEQGEVTSGIETTGTIVAAQKLDLNVYKQLSRIAAVNSANGNHVDAGTALISFDKSDALVSAASARVSVSDANLALQEQKVDALDPNTAIRSKESQIAGYKKTIAGAEQDLADTYHDFLNKDIETIVSRTSLSASAQANRTVPVLSGRYTGDTKGQYGIEIYASGANSGYSYRVSGLEQMVGDIIFGKALALGTHGLKITIPTDTRSSDVWVVSLPNTQIGTYNETKANYEQTVANLKQTIASAKTDLANAEQDLAALKRTDTTGYRDLGVEKAAVTLSEAQQKLSQSYDVLKERDIVAPFAGTVQDMENVVVGATPTGGTSDSINLGTLISDTFLTTFTLGASDVAKIKPGDKVKVTVTSLRNQPVFDATVTQVSSLPSTTGVAQYEVQAKLNYDRTSSEVIIREGMLADIEVVQQEKPDALRIPAAAVTYQNGQPTVEVVDTLTEAQQAQVTKMGIVKLDAGVTLPTHTMTVTLGIQGKYYVEVTSGLTKGDLVVSTATNAQTESTSSVQLRGFGGQRPEGEQPQSNTSSSRTSSGSGTRE